MTTELALSGHRWSAPRIQGFRHLHRMANMEGKLMAIAAMQRLTGEIDDSSRCQIAYIAFDFVWEGYVNRDVMSAGCAELADAVEQLALSIDKSGWRWALSVPQDTTHQGFDT